MSIDNKRGGKGAAGFTFALNELRQHSTAQAIPAVETKPHAHTTLYPARRPRVKLTLEDTKPEKSGFDPYNTSGSFDRSKHWLRVGKR